MRLIDADKLKAHYAWWKGGTREMTMDEAKSDFDCIIGRIILEMYICTKTRSQT